jgi:hypothetical protein
MATDRQLLRQLLVEWRAANLYYLRGALVPPLLALGPTSATLGQWQPDRRQITLSASLVRQAPWEQVKEVLRHEMAHQYAHEVLRARDERPHGQAFRHACEKLAVDPVVAGIQEAPGEDRSRASTRVRKLLALAASDNRHEAEAAMAKAQTLMLKHNLDLQTQVGTYTARIVGPRKLRFERWEQELSGLLTHHFFVAGIWVQTYLRDRDRTGRALELMGSTDNLDLAEHVHAFVTEAAQRGWKTYKRRQPDAGRADRTDFLLGVVRGFRDKLKQQTSVNEAAGLVWVGDANLDEHQAARYPRTASRRWRGRSGTSAMRAGTRVGNGLVLNKPVKSKAARGRLLS